jgi:hypothetical protein
MVMIQEMDCTEDLIFMTEHLFFVVPREKRHNSEWLMEMMVVMSPSFTKNPGLEEFFLKLVEEADEHEESIEDEEELKDARDVF